MIELLLVDDDAGVREALAFSLGQHGYHVTTAACGASALSHFKEHYKKHDGEHGEEQRQEHSKTKPARVVLTDLRMPGMSGLELLAAIKEIAPEVPVVVFTAYGSMDTAVQAMRLGAADFIAKPVSREVLEITLQRVLRQRELEEENADLRQRAQRDSSEAEILAVSSAMRAALELVDRVAETDATVIITGESGTGKELVARRLHQASHRRDGPWVAINCSALPPDLLEAELFGYEKGAFTGATRGRKGRFVEASGGTLFLDEIGDLSLDLQAKLLRVLQERTVDVVGGGAVDVDVRIVSATHRDLRAMIASGTFREDLYFRLLVVPIDLPPLRARTADVLPLFNRFLSAACQAAGRNPPTLSDAFRERLLELPWPGNVRELENMATRLAVTSSRPVLEPDDLGRATTLLTRNAEAAESAVRFDNGDLVLPAEGVALEALERAAVVAALSSSRGNQSQAARFLRIPRHVLIYRLEKYGIVADDWAAFAGSPRAPLVPSSRVDARRA